MAAVSTPDARTQGIGASSACGSGLTVCTLACVWVPKGTAPWLLSKFPPELLTYDARNRTPRGRRGSHHCVGGRRSPLAVGWHQFGAHGSAGYGVGGGGVRRSAWRRGLSTASARRDADGSADAWHERPRGTADDSARVSRSARRGVDDLQGRRAGDERAEKRGGWIFVERYVA